MSNPTKASRLLLRVSGLVLLLGGFWSAHQVQRAAWPHVEAEVLSVRIVEEQARDRPGGPAYAVFRPEIRYRYRTPDGVTAEARGFADDWRKTVGRAQRFVGEHPVGSRSRLSLMPGHPEQVRFGLELSLSTLWQPLLALGAGLLCGAIAWIGRRRLRSGWARGTAAVA